MSSKRLKDSEKYEMKINYTKTGKLPEGFYAINDKNGKLQIRRKKQAPGIEQYRHKIAMYQKKIDEITRLIEDLIETETEQQSIIESKHSQSSDDCQTSDDEAGSAKDDNMPAWLSDISDASDD